MACENATQGGIDSATVTLNGAATVYDCAGYRLPTEAEWEYSARAGTTTAYYDNQGLDEAHYECEVPYHVTAIAWYCGNEGTGTMPVGGKTPNQWGLYDMSGNVWEWVWDWLADYPGDITDPVGPTTGSLHVNRGGGWNYRAGGVRSACRGSDVPDHRYVALGFRVARTLP
jgi:formylglycine-generating enzyme required for sulfatase activity